MAHKAGLPLCLFVDPSAGAKGVHNSAFLEQLRCFAATSEGKQAVNLGMAVNRLCPETVRNDLESNGIAVLPVFNVDGYQLTGKPISAEISTPYVATLRENFLVLFELIRIRWPQQRISLVYHTMSWEHLLALGSALRNVPANNSIKHHAFAMYWPGVTENGIVVDAALRMQYKQALSALRDRADFNFYTGSVEYQQAFKSILPGIEIRLHPFFLDDWVTPCAPPKRLPAEKVKKILAYSGEIRDVKGFNNLSSLIPRLFERFTATQELVIHVAVPQSRMPAVSEKTWKELQGMAEVDPRIQIVNEFLEAEQINALVASSDVVSLAYDATFYKYKTSGFLWLARKLGAMCIVPEGTWMAREASRLELNVWDTELTPLHTRPDKTYVEKIMRPFAGWLNSIVET